MDYIMEIKKAFELSVEYLQQLYSMEESTILVEEVEEDAENGWFYITISFVDINQQNNLIYKSIIKQRTVKYLKLDISENKVVSMKNKSFK
jgi:hypothetical protein